MKTTNCFLIFCIFLLFQMHFGRSHEFRDRLDYQNVFSDSSEVTAIFLSCGNQNRMKITLQSFLAHFTYPLKEIVIGHCTDIRLEAALPKQYGNYVRKFRIIKGSGMESMMVMLRSIINDLDTPYAYLSDTQWKTIKGENFLQEAINIFKFCQTEGKNCYQVTANYPYWRVAARLAQMNWTSTGQAYNQIFGLVKQYEYFTMSPSLISLAPLKEVLEIVTRQNSCPKTQRTAYDICMMKEISSKVEEKKLLQIYLNDGTGAPYATPIVQE